MAKRLLYIVRHGKSSWKYDNVVDYDRPLKNKGIRGSYETAEKLKSFVKPEILISSPANRALHTATVFARVLEYPLNDLKINEILYGSHEEVVINFIARMDDSIKSVMIVGHNPTFTDVANRYVNELIDNIPTAGCVTLTFESDTWKDISRENLCSVNFIVPTN
jgi:phosphohistidine phosphatase